MVLIALECAKCGASLEVNDEASTYTCRYCHTVHERDYSNGVSPTPYSLRVMAERSIANAEYGKAMQFIEQGLALDPHHRELLALEVRAKEGLASLVESNLDQRTNELNQVGKLAEAEQNKLQALFILHSVQANNQVYGSNMADGATPADVPLAIEYINRSLEYFPDNPVYLNLKALLLWEGGISRDSATKLLEKAAAIDPRDITIQNNLKRLKESKTSNSSCFIATAAFGTPFALEVGVLRNWRDQSLLMSSWGKRFVEAYYRITSTRCRLCCHATFTKALHTLDSYASC